ncbi:MAG TPA: hypothetical protein PKD78_06600, partial [Saprospiraceae bacterium]|nr:hypothetical protein [Saprospiraceae bacterium]
KAEGLEVRMPVLVKDIADETLKAHFFTLKRGDTLRFNPRHLENHAREEMYRKYILQMDDNDDRIVGDDFEGTIDVVNRLVMADMDQDFFMNNFGTESREEAIEELKASIQQYYENRATMMLFRQLQKRLLELNPIELPEKFLKRWMKVTDSASASEPTGEEEFSNMMQSLRWTIIRNDLVDEFGITVSDREIREVFRSRIRGYFASFESNTLPDHIFDGLIDRMMKDKKDVQEAHDAAEADKLFRTLIEQITIQDVPAPSKEIDAAWEAL